MFSSLNRLKCLLKNIVTKTEANTWLVHENWIDTMQTGSNRERPMEQQQQQHALGDDVIEAVLC